MSSEVLKIAVAVIIAFALFAMLASFALGPKQADAQASYVGASLLNHTENVSRLIQQK